MQKNKVVFLVYTIHKNLTQNKDLNIRPRLVKYLEENTLEKLHDFLGLTVIFEYDNKTKNNNSKFSKSTTLS